MFYLGNNAYFGWFRYWQRKKVERDLEEIIAVNKIKWEAQKTRDGSS
jgi:hypothetical protein